jgi:hypothetical protein
MGDHDSYSDIWCITAGNLPELKNAEARIEQEVQAAEKLEPLAATRGKNISHGNKRFLRAGSKYFGHGNWLTSASCYALENLWTDAPRSLRTRKGGCKTYGPWHGMGAREGLCAREFSVLSNLDQWRIQEDSDVRVPPLRSQPEGRKNCRGAASVARGDQENA